MPSQSDAYHDDGYTHRRRDERYYAGSGGRSGTSPQYASMQPAARPTHSYDQSNAYYPNPPTSYPAYPSQTLSPPIARPHDFWQQQSLQPQGQTENVAMVQSQAYRPPFQPQYMPPTRHAGPDYAISDSPPQSNLPIPRSVTVAANPFDGSRHSVVAVARKSRKRGSAAHEQGTTRDQSRSHRRTKSDESRHEPDIGEDVDEDLDNYALEESIYSDSGRSDYYPPVPSRDHG